MSKEFLVFHIIFPPFLNTKYIKVYSINNNYHIIKLIFLSFSITALQGISTFKVLYVHPDHFQRHLSMRPLCLFCFSGPRLLSFAPANRKCAFHLSNTSQQLVFASHITPSGAPWKYSQTWLTPLGRASFKH